MPQTFVVHEDTLDGPIVGSYADGGLGAGERPKPGEIIELNGKRWRVAEGDQGERALLVHAVEDFEGLDDLGMALRHADESRGEEQDDAENADSPGGPYVEPGPRDRYS